MTNRSGARGRAWFVRGTEVAIIAVGLWFIFGDEGASTSLTNLLFWDLLTATYLGAGVIVVARHSRDMHGILSGENAGALATNRGLYSHRFKTFFVFVASVIGMTSAVTVVANRNNQNLGDGITAAGIVAIVTAWTLLHAGYAQLYASLYFRDGERGGGLEFPRTRQPGRVEFLYFAFMMGTTFSPSDVTVTSREMRWRVMVHSIVSFFYNAAILALAINIIIGL